MLQHAQIFRVTTSLLLRTLAWIRRLIELLIQSPRINIGSISSISKLNITFYNICNWLTLIFFTYRISFTQTLIYYFFLYSPPCTWSMRYSCIYSFSQWEFPCFLSLIIYKKSIDNSSQIKGLVLSKGKNKYICIIELFWYFSKTFFFKTIWQEKLKFVWKHSQVV